MDWVGQVESDVSDEVTNAIAAFKAMGHQMSEATNRVREAASMSAWPHFIRMEASSSSPNLMVKGR